MNDVLHFDEGCLSPAQLERLADASIDPLTRTEYEAHLATCARCATELDLLRSFADAKPTPAEESDLDAVTGRLGAGHRGERATREIKEPLKRNWWFRTPMLARWGIALASFLFVIAGGLQLQQMRRVAPVVDEAAAPTQQRSAAIEALAPSGVIATAPTELAWTRWEQADRYAVTVEEVDGTVLWRGASQDSRVPLPTEIMGKVVPRKTLLWQVTALGRDGEKLAESPKVSFRLP